MDAPQTKKAVRLTLCQVLEHIPAPREMVAMEMLPLAVGMLTHYLGAEMTAQVLENSARQLREHKVLVDADKYQTTELN
jgi:hypothetical protein